VTSASKFTIAVDSTLWDDFPSGGSGIVHQIKQCRTVAFKSLSQAIASFDIAGDVCFTDFAKFDVAADALRALLALDVFVSKHQRLPAPWNWDESQEFVATCRTFVTDENEQINERMMRLVALTAQGELCPIAAFLGGVLGQEVIKAVSGKFTPLHQWVCCTGCK
jgi:ubiquitin-activating enzyme E1